MTTRGEVVPFSRISSAMARAIAQDDVAGRALVATVVAVGPADRIEESGATLAALGEAGTVRGILICEGQNPAPQAIVSGNTVTLNGLKAPYIDNAVAALRLSSLPTIVWWRGGRPETLEGLADLADRIVLDEEAPEPIWRHAVTLFEESAFSDMRWARLTQLRALMAQFFDIPEVRAGASQFTELRVVGSDLLSARLLAAWLTSSLPVRPDFAVHIEEGDRGTPIQEVRLGDHEQALTLRRAGARTCLETAVSVRGHRSACRIVSLKSEQLVPLLTEELRIRARDLAFERALRTLVSQDPAQPLPAG